MRNPLMSCEGLGESYEGLSLIHVVTVASSGLRSQACSGYLFTN